MRRLLLSISLLVICGLSTHAGIIIGVVSDSSNTPISGATVLLQGTTLGAVSNDKGAYRIGNIAAGDYVLEVTRLGYKKVTREISLGASQTLKINFSLEEGDAELDEVVITDKSEARRISENPIQISSIDVVKLQYWRLY